MWLKKSNSDMIMIKLWLIQSWHKWWNYWYDYVTLKPTSDILWVVPWYSIRLRIFFFIDLAVENGPFSSMIYRT